MNRSVSHTGTLRVDAAPEHAFQLFTAPGERLWVDGWDPEVLSHGDGRARGAVFVTNVAGNKAYWVVVDYDELRGIALREVARASFHKYLDSFDRLAPKTREAAARAIASGATPRTWAAAAAARRANSPAERFGVRKGDVILKVNDKPVKTIEDFVKSMKNRFAGDTVKLKIERDGWRHDIRLTLGARPGE